MAAHRQQGTGAGAESYSLIHRQREQHCAYCGLLKPPSLPQVTHFLQQAVQQSPHILILSNNACEPVGAILVQNHRDPFSKDNYPSLMSVNNLYMMDTKLASFVILPSFYLSRKRSIFLPSLFLLKILTILTMFVRVDILM